MTDQNHDTSSVRGPTPPPQLDAEGLPPGYLFRADWEVTPRVVARQLLSDAPPLILDCRTEQERAICAMPGSMFVPLHELELKIDDVRDRLDDEGKCAVVVHCHHGARSLRATAVLRAAGIPTQSMAGGIHLWAVDIDRTLPQY
ncbi:MAG: rhodanese-like domain-containing protein [Phycisphaerae bacterium]|nr:rhodanese-like domain-containing protein [Phycisphaerae bacterium]